MVMYAPYRCCCTDEPCPSCCHLWCECPDRITVSTCTWVTEFRAFSCGSQSGGPCGIPDGTQVGSLVCTIKLTGVVFVKDTCETPTGTNCGYVLATGNEQTGLLEYTVDGNYRACEDSRLNDETDECECAWYDNICLGTATVPLNHATWISEIRGRLSFGTCCEGTGTFTPGDCGECTCLPSLSIYVEGSKPFGLTRVDCCPSGNGTSTDSLVFTTRFGAIWPCQHVSRVQGTCPSDLNDLDPSCSFIGPGCGCSIGQVFSPFHPVNSGPCVQGQLNSDYYTCQTQGMSSCQSLYAINYINEYEEGWSGSCPRCVTIGN